MYQERIRVLHWTFMPCCYCGASWENISQGTVSVIELCKKPHHFVRLTTEVRADIMWWKCFLGSWSGRSFFILQPFSQKYSQMHQVPGGVVHLQKLVPIGLVESRHCCLKTCQ